jgi:hypothetical protein
MTAFRRALEGKIALIPGGAGGSMSQDHKTALITATPPFRDNCGRRCQSSSGRLRRISSAAG